MMKKKLFSLLLALCLVMSLLPLGALASEEAPADVPAAEEPIEEPAEEPTEEPAEEPTEEPVEAEGTLEAETLAGDIVVLTKALLDSNYKHSNSYGPWYELPSGSYTLGEDLTLDTTVKTAGNATVTLDLAGHSLTTTAGLGLDLGYSSSLTLEDSSAAKTGSVSTIDLSDGAELTLESGTVNEVGIADDASLVANGGTVNGDLLNNGTIRQDAGTAGTVFTGMVGNFDGTISGGVFNGTVENYKTISGGVFNGTVKNYKTITGGVFNGTVITVLTKYLLDSNYKSGSSYNLPSGRYALEKNLTLDTTVEIAGNATVTLDLAGHELDTTSTMAFLLENGGTLTLEDSSEAQTGSVSAGGSAVITRGSSAAVILTGGKVNGLTLHAQATLTANGGTVTGHFVNNGTVRTDSGKTGTTFTGVAENNGTISGGQFENAVANCGTISGGVFRGAVKNGMADDDSELGIPGEISGGEFYGAVTNRAVVSEGETLPSVISGGVFHQVIADEGGIVVLSGTMLDNNYTKTGDGKTFYELPGGNYKLGESIALDTNIRIAAAAEAALDLAGYTLSGEPSALELKEGSHLTLTDSSAAGTGSVTSAGTGIHMSGDNTVLTLKGGTVNSLYSATGTQIVDANGGKVTGLVINFGLIRRTDDGTGTEFTGTVTSAGAIRGGIFRGTVENSGNIFDGGFFGAVKSNGTIYGGSFYGAVDNGSNYGDEPLPGTISGGVFYGPVTNLAVTNSFGTHKSAINCGVFYGGIVDKGGIVNGTTYRVSFDLNGYKGEEAPVTQVFVNASGYPALAPADPDRTDRTFLGWYAKGSNKVWNFDTEITGDVVLQAHWSGSDSSGSNSDRVPESPKTGDESPIALWLGVMAVCAMGVALGLKRKKA